MVCVSVRCGGVCGREDERRWSARGTVEAPDVQALIVAQQPYGAASSGRGGGSLACRRSRLVMGHARFAFFYRRRGGGILGRATIYRPI